MSVQMSVQNGVVCTCLYSVFEVKSLILLEGAGFITQRSAVQICLLLPVLRKFYRPSNWGINS